MKVMDWKDKSQNSCSNNTLKTEQVTERVNKNGEIKQ